MDENNKDGNYVVQEQGDLGLGTIPIGEQYIKENGAVETPEFNPNKGKDQK